MEIKDGAVNPFANEQTYTKEQLIADIDKELENIERRVQYLLELKKYLNES